jgi:microcystin-dependent protein
MNRYSSDNWIKCSGTTLAVRNVTQLYSLLGNRYGGDGYTTFAIPNLKSAGSNPKLIFCISKDGTHLNRNDDAPPEKAELLGQIRLLVRAKIPSDFLVCRGQVLAISDYRDIFTLIGNRFGGDGVNTFALPNLDGDNPHSDVCYAIAVRGPALSGV